MCISDVCLNRAKISSTWKSRINFYFLGGPGGNINNMDESSIPLDLLSVIAMLKAQRSAGSPQPSTSSIMPCQSMSYLQQETLSESPRPETEEFDVEVFIEEIKNFPCLWNTSLRSYHEKHTKNNSWIILSEKLERNGKDFTIYLGLCMPL